MADELLPRHEEFGLAKADQSKAPITDHSSASFPKQLLGQSQHTAVIAFG